MKNLKNITERKKAEEELKRKLEEQVLLLDNIETQIWYVTDVDTYGAVNKAFAEFNGIEKKDIEGKKIYDIRSKGENKSCLKINTEIFNKKKQICTEEWIKNSKGEERLLSIIKTPKLDEMGNVEHIICTADDITERKLTEQKLKESEEKFRKIAEQSLMGIIIAQDNQIKYINKTYANIFGYTLSIKLDRLGQSATSRR
ncbi:MAG: PAS domain-containing protein [Promethearchaeota archaeon]